ncbi:MAG: hypothetical protein ACLFUM_02800 [Spirochaetaceae bacterium]
MEKRIRRIRDELTALEQAAVDASSMIYMLKAGFFGYAAAELHFYTVGPVAREVGWPELPVRIADLRRGGEVRWTPETMETAEAFVREDKHGNDELLLELAESRTLAIVSEDHRIHERAQEVGIAHYNAPLILALVASRGRLSAAEYEECFELLRAIGYYSKDVLSLARAVASR